MDRMSQQEQQRQKKEFLAQVERMVDAVVTEKNGGQPIVEWVQQLTDNEFCAVTSAAGWMALWDAPLAVEFLRRDPQALRRELAERRSVVRARSSRDGEVAA
jgi:hypothetical protein